MPEPPPPAGSMTITGVQVMPGPGVVARYGDVLLWMEEGGEGGEPTLTRLLQLARRLADGGDGRDAGRQVAEVLRSDPRAVPALVLVTPTAVGLQAVVHGWGRLLADGVDIDGGWADRELARTTAFAAGRSGDHLRVPTSPGVLDLRRGSTPGAGVAVTLTTPGAAATGSASGVLPGLQAAPDRWGPLPVGDPGPAPGGRTVKGVLCSRGHLNNPVVLACATCRLRLDPVSRILKDGIRPSLGALVLDDGTTYGLDNDHLVGSAPAGDATVRSGGVRPVPVADPSGQMAPAHAEVRLVGWDVLLVARAPTFVLAPGTQQWSPASPGQPHPLPVGTRVAAGQRTFVIA